MQKSVRRHQYVGVAALLIVLAGSPVGAAEYSLTHYPPGTNTIRPALMPPPGSSVFLNYVTYYSADRFNNSKGNSAVPTYQVTAVIEAARLLHTWTSTNRVSWTSGVVIIASDVEQSVPNRRETGGGFGDLVIQPLLLTTTFGDLHVLAGFDVSLPTGRFNKKKLVNPGLNYYTVGPQVALTWLPTKKLELSLFSNVGFNSENPDTNYKSGNYLVVDYAAGYRPIPSHPALQVSVVGYMLKQFTDDEVNGVRFRDGNRGQAFAAGPQVRYQLGRGGIALKWLHEMAVENRPVGNRFQLQFAIPF